MDERAVEDWYLARGGSIETLRTFLNVQSDADFVLVVAWALACLRNRGPYPVIVLSGEQGSAKSTFSAILRALLDPNTAPLRALPNRRAYASVRVAVQSRVRSRAERVSHAEARKRPARRGPRSRAGSAWGRQRRPGSPAPPPAPAPPGAPASPGARAAGSQTRYESKCRRRAARRRWLLAEWMADANRPPARVRESASARQAAARRRRPENREREVPAYRNPGGGGGRRNGGWQGVTVYAEGRKTEKE